MSETTLYNALDKLGCSDKESRTYVELLKREDKSIAPLEDILGISRPNIYKLLNSLAKKGLIKIIDKGGNKKSYLPEPPYEIVELLHEKLDGTQTTVDELSNSLPDLMALYRQGELPTSIKVYEGKRQLNKTFDLVLKEAQGGMEFFGAAHEFIDFVSWKREHQFIKERMDKNIKVRALLLPSADASTLKLRDEDQLRETRILKGLSQFNTSFQLFGTKMVIWQPKTPLSLVINDQHMYQMFKSMFDFMWEQSK